MSRTKELLEQRAQERQQKRQGLLEARKSNLSRYVQMVADSSAPKTMGASNRSLPQAAPKAERPPSRLMQEMNSMSAKLNGMTDKREEKAKEKQKEARTEREGDLKKKTDDKRHAESNRNFDTLGKVFKAETEKVAEAIEDLTKMMKRQAEEARRNQPKNEGEEPSLLEQMQEAAEERKKKKRGGKRGRGRSRGGRNIPTPTVDADDFDIDGFDDSETRSDDARDKKRQRRLDRLRQQRSGGGAGGGRGSKLTSAWNRARGFGSSVIERGSGIMDKIGGSKLGKLGGSVLGKVGGPLAAIDAAYSAAPMVGDVFDSNKDTADRIGAGAHLAVQGAGGVIGGVLGGPAGAAMGASLGGQLADGAKLLGETLAENIDVYDMIHDKDGILQKTMGSVASGYDAIVDSDFGKALGVSAAIGMAPFSEDARKALKQDFEREIIPSMENKFDTVASAIGNYTSAVGIAGGKLMDGLRGAGSNIIDGFKDAGNQIADGYRKNGLVGAFQAVRGTGNKIGAGFGRAYDSAKDGVANAGSAIRYGMQKGTANTTDLAMGFSAKTGFKGMNDSQSKAYAATVMKTESGGALGITNQYGFAGQYQFGADALVDNGLMDKQKLQAAKKAAKANGKDWYKDGLHKQFMENNDNWKNEGGREAFLKNKQLQDDTFVGYTNKNIDSGYRSGALTSKSTAAEIAAYAKASHLKGAGGANDYFLRGIDSADANGMRVSTYANDAARNLNELTAKVDAAKANGAANPNAKAVANANAKPMGVTPTKAEATAGVTKAPLKQQLAQAKTPVRAKTSNAANAERGKGSADATATALAANTVDSSAPTATASAQPLPMLDRSVPAESQRVTVTNPPAAPAPAGNTIVQGGGGGASTQPTLDEIPMQINDMGLVLLNIGHV